MKYLLLILLSGCGQECLFESTMNICVFEDLKDGQSSGKQIEWTQEQFTRFEMSMKKHLSARYPGFDKFGTTIPVKDMRREMWQDDSKEWVAGLTYCGFNQVYINNTDLPASSLPHELFHVVQGCKTELPIDQGSDMSHSDWFRTGVYDDILEIQEESK